MSHTSLHNFRYKYVPFDTTSIGPKILFCSQCSARNLKAIRMLLKRIGGEAASVATKTEALLKQRMGHAQIA